MPGRLYQSLIQFYHLLSSLLAGRGRSLLSQHHFPLYIVTNSHRIEPSTQNTKLEVRTLCTILPVYACCQPHSFLISA